MTEPITARATYEALLLQQAAAAGTPLVSYTTLQSIDTLANYSYWRPDFSSTYPIITYSFPVVDNDPATPDEPADYIGNGRYGTLRLFTAEQAAAARLAFSLWDDLIPLSFVDAGTSVAADTRFFNSTLINTAGGAPAGSGTDGDVWIYNYDVNPPDTRDWSVGGFYFGYWMVHEIGHTLGLSHAGGYPSAGFDGLNYMQDSVIYSLMSYNSEGATGLNWPKDMATPMVNDVAAIQAYYGSDMTTRTGDTVYGFNSNVTDRLPLNFDMMKAAVGNVAPVTIWDAGGIDTLDLSGFGTNADIDLQEGGYTNANGTQMFIGIAYGAVIENAIGGRGNDIVHGNGANNNISGGEGNDAIYAGPETAPVPAQNPRDFVGIKLNGPASGSLPARNQYLSATGVTAFSGSAFTFEQLVDLTGVPSSLTAFASYNVSGNDNQFLLEGTAGTIKLIIANSAEYNTGYSLSKLLDGQPHRLSLTWEKATGSVQLYIDGTLEHSGTYAASATIKSAGTLIFGQEQDAPGGGFDQTQIFQGIMGDIRVFNTVRTANEINTNAFNTLTGPQTGLVHNWKVQTSDALTVTDFGSNAKTLVVVNGAVPTSTALPASTSHDDDTLIGGWGNDTLFGGAGDDRLSGKGDAVASTFVPVTAIELNPTGVTSQYAEIANFTGLSGASASVQFTIEMLARVSRLPGSEVDFFSYANSQSSNALLLSATNNGTISLNFRGTNHNTGIASSLLTDGREHRVSLTWNGAAVSLGNPDGNKFILYIDGAPVYSATHASQSLSLASGGTLIFGQEQDSIGGSFDANQILTGSIADIRVFNTVRTAAEIAANVSGPLADPAGTAGLVANWQPASGNTATISDAHGGVGLTLHNAPVATTFGNWDNDFLSGGDGNDTFYYATGEGQDTVAGGAGSDTLDLSAFSSAIWLNLARNDAVWTRDQSYVNSGPKPFRSFMQVSSVENANATDFADDLTGSTNANHLAAGAGNDILRGTPGGDTLDGGEGTDTVDYSANGYGVRINLGAGTAFQLEAGGGVASNDTLVSIEDAIGTAYDDTLAGVSGSVLKAGAGNDSLVFGGSALSMFDGGAGTDTADFSNAGSAIWSDLSRYTAVYTRDQAFVNTGPNPFRVVTNLTGIENLMATAFDDQIKGSAGSNQLDAGGGNDVLFGSAGGDTLIGGAGEDTVDYGVSAYGVRVDLGAGTGTQYGAGGSVVSVDTLVSIENATGSSFDDTLIGASGSGLKGGAGDDRLVFGSTMLSAFDGGAGVDTVDFSSFGSAIWADLGRNDAVYTRDQSFVNTGPNAFRVLANLSDVENLTGTAFNDEINGNANANVLSGGSGNDRIWGRDGADVIVGGAGNDILDGGNDLDRADYSANIGKIIADMAQGSVTKFDSGDQIAAVDKITSIEQITGTSRDDLLVFGGSNLLTFAGGGGSDTIDFSRFASAVWVDFTHNYEVYTRDGPDLTSAQGLYRPLADLEGVENVTGTAFADFIKGDAKANIFTGGAGADTFSFSAGFGSDVITDFTKGVDFIDLTAFHTNYNQLTVSSGTNGWTISNQNDAQFGVIVLSQPAGLPSLSAADFKL